MLEIKNLSASYGKKEVLKNVSLTFRKGEITSIIGPNGCGKTTLLNSVAGIIKNEKNTIIIDGHDSFSMKRKERAKKIAYLTQGKFVPDMEVEKLVLHGRFPHTSFGGSYSNNDKKIASDAMKKLSISHLATKNISTLSGGMRQNVFIAMALSQESDYILMDEPTTYLDIANQIKLMNILKDLSNQGKGIITVLHDLSLALSFSDKIAVMTEGQIAAYDIPENICSSDVIKNVFDVDIKKSEDGKSYYFRFDK